MPRYRFTASDLAPLTQLIGRPDAQRLLERAVPVKRFNPAPKALEQVPMDLPVTVQDRDHPDGLPLADVTALIKQRIPGVRSVLVRDGQVLVAYDQPPTDATRSALVALAQDKPTFDGLVAQRQKELGGATEGDLRNKLLQPGLDDLEWLKTFRLLQVSKLAGEPPPTPPRPARPPGGRTR